MTHDNDRPRAGGDHRGADSARPVLITGGAGFIGSNLADRLARAGRSVRLLDDLSRPGVEENAAWLRARHGDLVELVRADIRDRSALRLALAGVSQVFHFAAQVAVTSSLLDRWRDFEINLGGTLGLLEAMTERAEPPGLLFTSTNKVYGDLDDVELELRRLRYEPVDPLLRHRGVGEQRPLSFVSPYGCSKGGADQYVIDYARTLGLRSVVFRMSCIYGPRQFGTEDQGWVAHFLLQQQRGEPIVLYGDGRQVRDVLYVDDLVEAILLAEANLGRLSGRAFNIGGGPGRTVSLLELLELMERLEGRKPKVVFEHWRAGDQRYYVSDSGRFRELTGWEPKVSVVEGVERLHRWLRDRRRAVVRRPSRPAAEVPAAAELAP